jgi:hypothetical protein
MSDYRPKQPVREQDQLRRDDPIIETRAKMSGDVWGFIRSCTMQEILSKTVDPDAPLQGQEFYDLRLFEEPNQLGTRHCVRQTHTKWSDSNFDVIWEGEEVDYFWTLDEAKTRYAERKAALAFEGFIYSDMD